MKSGAVALLPALASTALPGANAGQPAAPPPRLTPAEVVRVMRLEPGRWRTDVRVTDVQLVPATPGAAPPPGAAEAARGSIGMTQAGDSCIGAGLAADGALVLPGVRIAAQGCGYEALDAANGRLRLVGVCGPETMRMDATYAPARMAGALVSDTRMPAGGGMVVRTTLRFESTRAGACS